MSNFKKIVVPLDFTKTSIHALGEALFLAKKNGAEVVIVHVNTDTNKTERHFNEEIRAILGNIGEVAHNIDVSWRIIPGSKGNIIRIMSRTIDQLEPLFIVVGYDIKNLSKSLGSKIKDIIYQTNYPVVALKSGETVRELTSVLFPLTLEANSRQKTNISIKFAKDMGLDIVLYPMRLNNTAKDDVTEKHYVNQLTTKFEDQKVAYSVEWADGKDAIDLILNRTNYNKTDIIGVVFESSPDFFDNFRTTREEKVLVQNTNPLLIVKSHHSPYIY